MLTQLSPSLLVVIFSIQVVSAVLCRVKSLFGAKPHTNKDAVKAAGMGAPDNGKKPVVEVPICEYDTEAVSTGVRGLDME